MKCLLVATALMAAVAMATPHIVNEFSIPLGHRAATPATAFLAGDLYVVSTTDGLAAVNLTTKTSQWYTALTDVPDASFVTMTNVLIGVNTLNTVGVDLMTGKLMWTQTGFYAYASGKDVKFDVSGANVIISTPSQIGVLDITTGHVVAKRDIAEGGIVNSGILYYISNEQLKATDLLKDTKLWTSNAATAFSSVLYADANYVVAADNSEDTGSGEGLADTTMYVIKASNGERQIAIQAMNGITQDHEPITIVGTNLTVVAGDEVFRRYVIDITTGAILSMTVAPDGGSTSGGGEHSVIRADGSEIKVKVTPTMPAAAHGTGFEVVTGPVGGPYTVACAQTPSSSFQTTQADNLQYFGDGLVKVGNLQGYVMFYLGKDNTCTILDINEMLPNWTPPSGGKITKFGGDFIEVKNDNVIGYKVVQ